ncbi:MAG: Crp/Fnr family transcriptional regulator, partial [Halofilum sp. (in: g-proteobacteria)]
FRGSRAVALERSGICSVRLTSLLNLAKEYSGLQEQVYSVLERAKAHTEKHALMMGWRRADERIALFLHDWWQRRQRAGLPGRNLYLPMRREDLASCLGLVPETASRSMSRLRELGIIDLPNHYNVRILDREQLARLARIDPPSD